MAQIIEVRKESSIGDFVVWRVDVDTHAVATMARASTGEPADIRMFKGSPEAFLAHVGGEKIQSNDPSFAQIVKEGDDLYEKMADKAAKNPSLEVATDEPAPEKEEAREEIPSPDPMVAPESTPTPEEKKKVEQKGDAEAHKYPPPMRGTPERENERTSQAMHDVLGGMVLANVKRDVPLPESEKKKDDDEEKAAGDAD